MSASVSSSRVRIGKWIVRLLCALLLILPVAAAGVWLSIHHVPQWYRPPVIAPQDYQEVRDDFESVFNEMSEKLMSPRPFKLVLSDRQLNNWLAVRGEILPEAAAWVPTYLDDPMIRFESDLLTVAGTVSKGNVRSVVSLRWRIKVHPETITLRLERTKSGSLPLPEGLIAKALARTAGTPSAPGSSVGEDGLKLAGKLQHAGTGLDIRNRFRWTNGDRLFRITDIESRDGHVRLSIQPLDH